MCLFVLEHPHRFFFKNVRFYKPFWNVPLLLSWTDFHYSCIFPMIYSIFATFTDPLILAIFRNCCISNGKRYILLRSRIQCFGPIFEIFIFPLSYSKNDPSTDSLSSSIFQNCCISAGKPYILVRRWIRVVASQPA